MKTLHIATAADLRYFPGVEVLVASTLLSTARHQAVHFHVIDGGIPDPYWIRLRENSARLHPQVVIHRLPFSSHFDAFPGMGQSRMTYARLLLGNLLPQVEKLIYLDSDIIVTRDPAELLQLEMGGRTALAMPDPTLSTLNEDCPWLNPEVSRRYRYFNSGVLVLDLNRWRELGYFEQSMEALSQKAASCRYWDQTVLNYVLRDDVGPLPREFNWYCADTNDLPAGPANFHLCGLKPWIGYAPRYDQHLWRAFYLDVLSPQAPWPRPASSTQIFLDLISRYRGTRWIFYLVMRVLIRQSNHEHQRRTREMTLFCAMKMPGLLRKPRAIWKAQLASATKAEAGRVSPVPTPAVT